MNLLHCLWHRFVECYLPSQEEIDALIAEGNERLNRERRRE
jgi:hypothetical protein